MYTEFLDFLGGGAITLMITLFSGATALQFQASVKKPNRANLEEFRDSLPMFLQQAYFSSKNSITLYTRASNLEVIEFLLQSTFYSSLFVWVFAISCEIGIHVIFSYIRYLELGYIPLPNILSAFISFIVFLRISLFGIKIKHG